MNCKRNAPFSSESRIVYVTAEALVSKGLTLLHDQRYEEADLPIA
jgi:hypothetical protein